jgi:hypothetical protein
MLRAVKVPEDLLSVSSGVLEVRLGTHVLPVPQPRLRASGLRGVAVKSPRGRAVCSWPLRLVLEPAGLLLNSEGVRQGFAVS